MAKMLLDNHTHSLLVLAAARRTLAEGRRVTMGETLRELLAGVSPAPAATPPAPADEPTAKV